jgi:tetratricopeptide (TPR) repeat protein
MKKTTTLLMLGLSVAAMAQNMKKERITVSYLQPPTIHLEEGMGYTSSVILDYEAEVNAELAKAEEEYQQALAEYPEKEAAAKAAYDQRYAEYEKALEDWNSKSSVGKIIEKQVLENSKPTPPSPYYPPSKPYKRQVTHQKLFNADQLASTYCRVEGLDQDPNGVNIEVHLFGFENNDPIAEKKEYVKVDSKTKAKSTYYKSFWKIDYRHSMTLRAVHPNGSIIFDEVPSSISDYKTFTSGEEERSYPSTNAQTYIDQLQTKVVEENMGTIQWLINDKLGTTEQKRNVEIIYVKNKKGAYDDLENAMYDAKQGYDMLISRPDEAHEKLQSAIDAWEAALAEGDMDDKKARINKKVIPDLYKNLIMAYTMIGEFDKADDHFNDSLRLDFSRGDENDLKETKLLTDDLRERYQK